MAAYCKIQSCFIEKKENKKNKAKGKPRVYIIISCAGDDTTAKMRIDNYFMGWFDWRIIDEAKLQIIELTITEFIGHYYLFSIDKKNVKSGVFTRELCSAARTVMSV